MKTTTEIEIKVSGEKVTNAMVDAVSKATGVKNDNMAAQVEESKSSLDDDMFVRVEASKLSLNDQFMQYMPETDEERKFKRLLETAIKSGGLKDFIRPKYAPSFNKDGICCEPGKIPASGKSYNWWNQVAKEFKPEYNSRLGTKTEYVAFLGVLIKKLVESGWSAKKAWYAVCNDSKELGHYWDSENAKHDYELTGRREICGFYDLANIRKILAVDEEIGGFWFASGWYGSMGYGIPLADLEREIALKRDFGISTGWIVLEIK